MRVSLSIGLAVCVASIVAQGQPQSIQPFFVPEKILTFGNYLYSRAEFALAEGEYRRYLHCLPKADDSIGLRVGYCRLYDGRPGPAMEWFRELTSTLKNRSCREEAGYLMAYSLFVQRRYSEVDSALVLGIESPPEQHSVVRRRFLSVASRLLGGPAVDWHSLMSGCDQNISPWQNLQQLCQKRDDASSKSPVLAGVLSSVVPGLGKMYAGRFEDGLLALLAVGVTAWQGVDGFSRDGSKSVKGWIFGSMSAVMYGGNILGSVVEVEIQHSIAEHDFRDSIHALVKTTVQF